jgi:hypothetical protein
MKNFRKKTAEAAKPNYMCPLEENEIFLRKKGLKVEFTTGIFEKSKNSKCGYDN